MPVLLTTRLKTLAAWFGIRDMEIPFYLSQVITPIMDVAAYGKTVVFSQLTHDLIGAGTHPIHTVPAGKKWTVLGVWKGPMSALAWASITTALGVIVPLQAAATDHYYYPLNPPLQLPAGASINISTPGNAGDGARTLTAHYLEEDA